MSTGFQFGVESVSFDVLHHHINHAIAGCPQVVDGDGVRMTKTARRLTFTTKATQPFGIVPHFRWQNFYRHPVAEENMAGAKDGAHAAFPQQRLNLVLAIKDGADDR